jgi:hypothetical protein
MRINQGQEFIIGGCTPSPKNFDALILGYYDGDKLVYAPRTRNGFAPGLPSKAPPTIPLAGNPRLAVPESAGGARRPLGPRLDC